MAESENAYSGSTDEEILAMIASGDTKATDYLMDKYKNFVRSKAKTLFLIGADKEDLIQEGMIGLYKAIRDFLPDREASFMRFADVCISRQMYSAITMSNTKKNIPLNNYISIDAYRLGEEGTQDNPLAEQNHLHDKNILNPEDLVIDKECTNMIEYTLVGRLSKLEKEVLSDYLKDYHYSRIAKRLGKEPKAIDNALQRIKKKLTQVLAEQNVTST